MAKQPLLPFRPSATPTSFPTTGSKNAYLSNPNTPPSAILPTPPSPNSPPFGTSKRPRPKISGRSRTRASLHPARFDALGWKLKYQAFLQGREPDYALFLSDEDHRNAIHAGRKSPEFWKFPKLLADAKAWHVSLDRPIVTSSQREFPPQQIEWYLNNSQLDYAILTNGQLWRLFRNRAPTNPASKPTSNATSPTS